MVFASLPRLLWVCGRQVFLATCGFIEAARESERKTNAKIVPPAYRDRETPFIDARQIGSMNCRTQKVLTEEDIARIADTYHVWLSGKGRESFSAGPQSSHLGSDEKAQQSSDLGAESEKDSRPSLHGPGRFCVSQRFEMSTNTTGEGAIHQQAG